MANTELAQFDIESLNETDSIFALVLGRRRSVKSYLMRHILEVIGSHFDFKILMTDTAFITDTDYSGINRTYIGFQDNIIERLINSQYAEIRRVGRDRVGNVLVILDDVVDDNMRRNKQFNKLATQGRHYKISVFIAAQRFNMQMGPTCRSNLDISFVFKIPSLEEQRNVAEMVGVSKSDFSIMNTALSEHQCLVIDNREFDESKRIKYYYVRN